MVFYTPPLVIARLLGRFANNERLTMNELVPYVLTFAGLWLAGEAVWRIAAPFIAREIGASSLFMWKRWMNCWQRISLFFRTTLPAR